MIKADPSVPSFRLHEGVSHFVRGGGSNPPRPPWQIQSWLLHMVQRGGSERAAAPPSPLLAVPNVTALPLTASVPASYYSMWCYNDLCTLKG